MGDNAMLASEYGIKNLQRILVKLPDWTKTSNEGYDDLYNMYNQLTTQFNRYMGHVSKNIGGIYENPKTVEQEGTVYERTPVQKQKEALAFLDKQLFSTPLWLADSRVLDNIGLNSLQVISRSQEFTLNRLLSTATLGKLITAEAVDGKKAYQITSFFEDINTSIFRELRSDSSIDVYRRNLQKMYVDKLIELSKPGISSGGNRFAPAYNSQSDVLSVVKAELRNINSMISATLPNQSDSLSKYHLQDLADRINFALNPRG